MTGSDALERFAVNVAEGKQGILSADTRRIVLALVAEVRAWRERHDRVLSGFGPNQDTRKSDLGQ